MRVVSAGGADEAEREFGAAATAALPRAGDAEARHQAGRSRADVRRVQRQLRRPLVVITDRLPAHRAAAMRLEADQRFVIEWLPAYAPDLNPVEDLSMVTLLSQRAVEPLYDIKQMEYGLGGAERFAELFGIDFWFTCRCTKQEFSVELKTDERAAKTGNLFFEVAHWTKNAVGARPLKRGWGVTCKAQYVLVYVPKWEKLYSIPTYFIHCHRPKWESPSYRRATCDNCDEGRYLYSSQGILVPFERDIEPFTRTIQPLRECPFVEPPRWNGALPDKPIVAFPLEVAVVRPAYTDCGGHERFLSDQTPANTNWNERAGDVVRGIPDASERQAMREDFEERASIIQYDGAADREQAERAAFERLQDQDIQRLHQSRSAPD